jgi:hypothetical protein
MLAADTLSPLIRLMKLSFFLMLLKEALDLMRVIDCVRIPGTAMNGISSYIRFCSACDSLKSGVLLLLWRKPPLMESRSVQLPLLHPVNWPVDCVRPMLDFGRASPVRFIPDGNESGNLSRWR